MPNLIPTFKFDTFEKAQANALSIVKEGEEIGKLIPIGSWILNQDEIVRNMSLWRRKAMKNFLVQFDSTFERTKDYLQRYSVEMNDRILFLIFTEHNECIGHIGMANVNQISGELDNLMRGVSGGRSDLILYAEHSILEFCFNILQIKFVKLRVLSFNFLPIQIHQRLGFKLIESLSLQKIQIGDEVHLKSCEPSDSNVPYKLVLMELDQESFLHK